MNKHYIGNYLLEINDDEASIKLSSKRTIKASSSDKLYAYIRIYLDNITEEALAKKIDSVKTETYSAFHLFITSLFMSQELLMGDGCVELIEFIMNKTNEFKLIPDLSPEEELDIIKEDKFRDEHLMLLRQSEGGYNLYSDLFLKMNKNI